MSRETVSRSVDLDATPSEVWRALTEASFLSDWFEAEVDISARPNGAVRFRFVDGTELRGVVVACDPPLRLSFRWRDVLALDEPRTVEFSLEELAGGTRLTVTESPGVVPAEPRQGQTPEALAR